MNENSEATLHFLDYWRVIKLRWTLILIIFLLVTIVAGVTCYFLPREYLSKVTIEVKPDETGMKIFTQETGLRTMTANRLAPTQFQILMSKEVLYPVVDSLNLTEKWARDGRPLPKEQAYYYLLRKMKESREIRNTDMIEVLVYSTNPQEAADIANSVAQSYQDKRRQDQMDYLTKSLSEVEAEVVKKRRAVELAQEEMQKIAAEEGIVDLNPESTAEAETPARANVARMEQQVSEASIALAELRAQIAEVDKLESNELMTAVQQLNIQDSTIAKIIPVYQDAVVEETRLLNYGLGENHPRIKALRAQKEIWAKQLSEQVKTLRTTLGIRLAVEEAKMAALNTRLESSRDAFTGSRQQTVAYVNAKNRYISAKTLLHAAEGRLESQRMQLGLTIYPANIWEHAEASTSPARPNIPAYMSIAMGVGLIFGIGMAFFLEYLDTSVKNLDEVERFLSTPVLAVIPKGISYLVHNPGDSPDAEAYRILQTNLEFNRKDPNANTITLVSGGLGEGKSTTLNNLAYTYAKGGYRTLIVDADLRRAAQHVIFGVDNKEGLTDVLLRRKTVEEAVRSTQIDNLFLLPAGRMPEDATGILNSTAMSDLILQLKQSYDIVFFDSPPILGLSDASILARDVDITLLVVQYRRFPRSMLMRVKQSVLHVGGNLLGAVLNNVDVKRDSNYQYYTQYYDYYGSTRNGKKTSKTSEALAARDDTPSSSDAY